MSPVIGPPIRTLPPTSTSPVPTDRFTPGLILGLPPATTSLATAGDGHRPARKINAIGTVAVRGCRLPAAGGGAPNDAR